MVLDEKEVFFIAAFNFFHCFVMSVVHVEMHGYTFSEHNFNWTKLNKVR